MPTYPGDDITGPAMTTTCRHSEWEMGASRFQMSGLPRGLYVSRRFPAHVTQADKKHCRPWRPAQLGRDRILCSSFAKSRLVGRQEKAKASPDPPGTANTSGNKTARPQDQLEQPGFPSLLASSPHTLPGKPSRFGRHLATHHLLGAASSLTSHLHRGGMCPFA